jgi:phosphinothricin acetyltransferase
VSTIEEVHVRPARNDDAGGIAAVFAPYVTDTVVTFETTPPSAGQWQERRAALADAGLPFLVLARDDEVLGYALASQWRPKPAYRHSMETTIYLAPGHTGRGYGRRLLGELLTRCGETGAHQAIAIVADSGSEASLALHRSAGFEDVGRLRRVGFKHGR